MATKIKVSKAVHSFVCMVVKKLAVKLMAKGYTIKSCNTALYSKISPDAFVKMVFEMFKNGLTVDAAADGIIKTLAL